MSYAAQQAMQQKLISLSAWYTNLKAADEFPGTHPVIYDGNVTGLTQYHYREVYQQLTVGMVLRVKPHPENKYDPNATGIYHHGQQIGWVPKQFNDVCAKALQEGRTLFAHITKHNRCDDYQQMLFVEIRVTSGAAASAPLPQRPVNRNEASQRVPRGTVATHAACSQEIQGNNPSFVTVDEAGCPEPYSTGVDQTSNFLQLTPQGLAMSKTSINSVVEKNISLGTSAAFLEAGRIANNQLSSIAGKKLPIMVRAYADTALGRLLLANVALMARDHFRPDDERLGKLVNAMTVAAYQEVLQNFDVEQMIEDLISNSTIKKALKSIDNASAKE